MRVGWYARLGMGIVYVCRSGLRCVREITRGIGYYILQSWWLWREGLRNAWNVSRLKGGN